MVDAEGTGLAVFAESAAQHARGDTRNLRHFARGDVGVADVQFADHLADEVGQVVAVLDVGEHHRIFVVDGVPVYAVHVLHVEVVAGHAPAFVEDLFPFGRVVDEHVHFGSGHGILELAGAAEAGDIEFAAFADQAFLVVRRKGHGHVLRSVGSLQGLEVEHLDG